MANYVIEERSFRDVEGLHLCLIRPMMRKPEIEETHNEERGTRSCDEEQNGDNSIIEDDQKSEETVNDVIEDIISTVDQNEGNGQVKKRCDDEVNNFCFSILLFRCCKSLKFPYSSL